MVMEFMGEWHGKRIKLRCRQSNVLQMVYAIASTTPCLWLLIEVQVRCLRDIMLLALNEAHTDYAADTGYECRLTHSYYF